MTQERRRGPENNLSGPQFNRRSLHGPPILEGEPGRDDKFRPGYCDSCKVPESSEPLLTFELRLHGKSAGFWTLCGRCWAWRNERPNPDPLHVPEEAA